ncbi:MAG: Chromate resistance protein ChrB [Propionibacteriaceae bacterium]
MPDGDQEAADRGRGPEDSDRTVVEEPADWSETGWLLLTYRIPSEPSRLRAGVWRRLKGHGAIYLQNSVAALPDTSAHERLLRRLRAEIGDLGGTAQLFRSAALAGGGDVVLAYNAARDDEYEELLDKCQDFLAEIARETAAGHTTYGELEENDEDLAKLRRWVAKIDERDVLDAAAAETAAAAIERCAAALEEFAQRVYGADPDAR